MRIKLAVTSAAALLAATLFAAAQTQPGATPPEQPPQGADTGMTEGSSAPPAGGQGTVGAGQPQSKKKGMSEKDAQPGGAPPSAPPQQDESASPSPR